MKQKNYLCFICLYYTGAVITYFFFALLAQHYQKPTDLISSAFSISG